MVKEAGSRFDDPGTNTGTFTQSFARSETRTRSVQFEIESGEQKRAPSVRVQLKYPGTHSRELEIAPQGKVRTLGIVGMVSLGFFLVCGGYGTEPLVEAAPPAVVVIVLLAAPWLYSFPIALMVGELATAIPEEGGNVVWIARAFGQKLGNHNAWWYIISWLIDSAVYPVLAAKYILQVDEECASQADEVGICFILRGSISTGVVLFVTVVKLLGMSCIIRFSTFLAGASLVPLIVYICAGLPKLTTDPFENFDGTPGYTQDYALLVSLVLWLNCGFFGIGVLAGEVVEPVKRTYMWSTIMLLLASAFINFMPIYVALCQEPDQNKYKGGYFGTLAGQLIHPFMVNVFQVGATLSMLGLYNAQSMQAEISLGVLMAKLFPQYITRKQREGTCLWSVKGGGSRMYILLNSVVTMAVVWLPYSALLEGSMIVGALGDLLLIAAFFQLRWAEPGLDRPFKACQSTFLCVLLLLPPTAALFTNIYFNLDPHHPNFVLVSSVLVGTIASSCLAHLLAYLMGWTKQGLDTNHSFLVGSNSADLGYDAVAIHQRQNNIPDKKRECQPPR